MYKLTVIGNPIAHSLSPFIHTHFAKQTNLSIFYDRTESPIDSFKETVFQFRDAGGFGANVTIPFKEQAYLLCSKITERAVLAKAVNTLKFMANGDIYGDNTDGAGLIKDIVVNHSFSLAGRKILILGAGGATRGILYPLLKENPQRVWLVNRTQTKAKTLEKEFSLYGNIQAVSFEDITETVDVIMDCTPVTAWPLPIPEAIFRDCSLVYDLKYTQGNTPILDKARLYPVKQCLNGLGMLIEQAAEAFFFWTGVYPDTKMTFSELKNER